MGSVVYLKGKNMEKNPLTLEAMAELLNADRVLIPSRHIVKIEHEDRVKYVVVFDAIVHTNTEIAVSECNECADGTGRIYPLLKNMNPVDLGSLTEFIASENREEIYHAILDTDIDAEDRELLVLVRAVEMLRHKKPLSLDEFSIKSAIRSATAEWQMDQSANII